MTQPRMPKTAPPLSRRLEAAFARLDPATPVPAWLRAVRIGVDYSLRVSGIDPQTESEADSLAYLLCTWHLSNRDPPGDPPATESAQQRAGKAGPRNAQAFATLGTIRDAAQILKQHGEAVPTLPDKAMAVLQAAARGERRDETTLELVITKAEALAQELASRVLKAGHAAPPQTDRRS